MYTADLILPSSFLPKLLWSLHHLSNLLSIQPTVSGKRKLALHKACAGKTLNQIIAPKASAEGLVFERKLVTMERE